MRNGVISTYNIEKERERNLDFHQRKRERGLDLQQRERQRESEREREETKMSPKIFPRSCLS